MSRRTLRNHLEPGDTWAMAMACAAIAGAFLAVDVTWPIVVTVVLGAALWRRPLLVVVVIACVTSGLAVRAEHGLVVDARAYSGTVTAVRDGEVIVGTPSVEVRADGHHLRLVADHDDEAQLADVAAGDRLVVEGTVIPATQSRGQDRVRHIAGRLRASHVAPGPPSAWWWRLSDTCRRGVESLATPLPRTEQALFDGFVLGDATQQRAIEAADFQGAGLTHLLVVSGENVAFLLAMAGPLLRRCGYRLRFVATVLLLIGFALVTRFEPSVLRAAAMAAVAAIGAGFGRPVGTWRSLALAVTALVIADPFLVHSVGFGLSLGASVGIIAAAGPVEAVLPGPGLVRRPLAVTIAAQFGVAPLMLGVFGTLPVATLPANVLAGPAAGLVVIVGLPVLAVAHVVAPLAGALVWLPQVLLWWIGAVARESASLPLGNFGVAEMTIVAVFMFGAVRAAKIDRTLWSRQLLVVAFGVCAMPGVRLACAPRSAEPVAGLSIVRTTTTTVVVLTASPLAADLLSGLTDAGVRHIDLVVMPHGDAADRAELALIRHRCTVNRVMIPSWTKDPWTGSIRAGRGERRREGDIVIDVVLDRPVLAVHAFTAGQAAADR